jgi:hypothetical protein
MRASFIGHDRLGLYFHLASYSPQFTPSLIGQAKAVDFERLQPRMKVSRAGSLQLTACRVLGN